MKRQSHPMKTLGLSLVAWEGKKFERNLEARYYSKFSILEKSAQICVQNWDWNRIPNINKQSKLFINLLKDWQKRRNLAVKFVWPILPSPYNCYTEEHNEEQTHSPSHCSHHDRAKNQSISALDHLCGTGRERVRAQQSSIEYTDSEFLPLMCQ